MNLLNFKIFLRKFRIKIIKILLEIRWPIIRQVSNEFNWFFGDPNPTF